MGIKLLLFRIPMSCNAKEISNVFQCLPMRLGHFPMFSNVRDIYKGVTAKDVLYNVPIAGAQPL